MFKTSNIISLGAWCRPAWQIRRYFETEKAYPYDWHITSYAALVYTLSNLYEPEKELLMTQCRTNRFGSITDLSSGLIFQHDLPSSSLQFSGDEPNVEDLSNVAITDNARSKMSALFGRFRRLCEAEPVIFVRWLRAGHPDGEWPEAFLGENPSGLYDALQRFCGHSAFKLLYVTSEERARSVEESLCKLSITEYGATARLVEDLGPHPSWTGESDAWTALFDEVRTRWGG